MDEAPSPLFLEDKHSDSDTISLTSTVQEEVQEEYTVDCILTEEDWVDEHDGSLTKKWLVKWVGYGEHESTFEPYENFSNDIPLQEWREKKKRIDAGLEAPFDLDQFYVRQQEEIDKVADRKARRKEKREKVENEKRRASDAASRASTSFEIGVDSDNRPIKKRKLISRLDLLETSSPAARLTSNPRVDVSVAPPKRRVTAGPVLKKGTAQKVIRRRTSISSGSDESEMSVNDIGNPQYSLFNERSLSSTRSAPRRAARESFTEPNLQAAALASLEISPTETSNSEVQQERSLPQKRNSSTNADAVTSKAALKSSKPSSSSLELFQPLQSRSRAANDRPPAPTGDLSRPTAKRTKTTTMFIDPNARRKSKQRVNEHTARTISSDGRRFTTLKEQNRYQKFGRQNELEPQADSLTFIDPKTGKTIASGAPGDRGVPAPSVPANDRVSFAQAAEPRASGHPDINASSSRRQDSAGTTIRTLMSSGVSQTEIFKGPTQMESDQANRVRALEEQSKNQPVTEHKRKINPKTDVTCRKWLRNNSCSYGSECHFAHHRCDILEPKTTVTCTYWRTGKCRWPDELCEFHHVELDPKTHKPIVNESPAAAVPTRRATPVLVTSHISAEDRPHGSAGDSRDVTCRFWYKGLCNKSEDKCPLAHRRCDKIDPKRNYTCSHWQKGFCRFSEAKCECYHQDFDSETNQPLFPIRFQTCPAWKFDNCPLQASECPYYHVFFDPHPLEPLQFQEKILAILATFDDYEIMKAGAVVSTGALDENLSVRLVANRQSLASFFPTARPIFSVTHLCLPTDMGLLEQGVHCSGALLHDDVNDWPAYDALADYLVQHGFGAVASSAQHTIVIYPAGDRTWSSFSRDDQLEQFEVGRLRFTIQSSTSNLPASLQGYRVTDSPLADLCEHNLVLDQARFFRGSGGRTLRKEAFLMFLPDAKAESNLLTAYLQSKGATVHHLNTPGAWETFKSSPGLILYHPSVTMYKNIPSFYDTLFEGSVNHFQVGIDDTLLDHPLAATTYSCVRLFPSGSAMLFTDDCLVQCPQHCLDAVNHLFPEGSKPSVAKNDRIVFRPGILNFLETLLAERPDSTHRPYWDKLYVRLAALMLERRDLTGRNSISMSDASIVSLPIEEAPSYARLYTTNEEEATDWLVNWFAGWCVMQRERLRRFTVVHRGMTRADATPGQAAKDPKSQEWMANYQHLYVRTPERYLQVLKGKK